jgi:(p)ppGpp synthase/HD superfamily hydrolase
MRDTRIQDQAYMLAARHHKGQLYGTEPYTEHLADVVQSLWMKHGDSINPVLVATAWLHDVLEDTECTWEEIVAACGDEVARAVVCLTKHPQQAKEWYIARIKACPIALEVKIHDSLCNLRASVMSGERGRVRKYSQQLMLLVEG